MRLLLSLLLGLLLSYSVQAQTATTTQYGVVKLGTGWGTVTNGIINAPSGSGSAYTVTTLTRAAVQAALDAITSNAVITLAPGIYSGFNGTSLNLGGKTNVSLMGFGAATFSSTVGNTIYHNGDLTNCKILGINFVNTGTGNSNIKSQIQLTANGFVDGLEIAYCSFTSPNLCQNGITATMYNVIGDGGDGTGKLCQDLNIHDCRFVDFGRIPIELVNHSWNDNKTDVYLKSIRINHNYFRNSGTVAEPDGTFNGMAISNSGYAYDVTSMDNHIIDAKLLGIEYAGVNKGVIVGNTVDWINNSFVGISVSDNGHNAAKNITVSANNITSKLRCLNFNQVKDFTVSNNSFNHNPATSTDGVNGVYFQACSGGSFTGGVVIGRSYNPVRLDDTSNMFIGGGMRIKNYDTNGYSLVSIYGNPGNGSFNNIVGQELYFEKSGGPAASSVVEAYGNVSGNSGAR